LYLQALITLVAFRDKASLSALLLTNCGDGLTGSHRALLNYLSAAALNFGTTARAGGSQLTETLHISLAAAIASAAFLNI
jgi:hypothetical protein